VSSWASMAPRPAGVINGDTQVYFVRPKPELDNTVLVMTAEKGYRQDLESVVGRFTTVEAGNRHADRGALPELALKMDMSKKLPSARQRPRLGSRSF
jgi:hypothetical protein